MGLTFLSDGSASAGKPLGHVTWLVWLPEGLHPGRAMLTAGMAQAPFTVGH
ncbi:MAG: hypothetical protein ACR2JU_13770 [Nocardioidaceae bacterium]